MFTAAVLHVRRDGRVICESAFGDLAPGGPATAVDSLFDIASLTKLFVSAAVLALFDRRVLSLNDPIVALVPEFDGKDRRRRDITFKHLLSHTSGLPAHANFRDEVGAAAIVARVCGTPLAYSPGCDVVYSDLGFMLAGEALGRLCAGGLAEAVGTNVVAPLRASSVTYAPPATLREHIVCTENDPWRGRLLRGEVHDENCWAMGGVAGHAGLFATASDVAQLGEMFRQGGEVDGHRVISRSAARLAVREHARGDDERRGLGWALKASDRHSCGARLSLLSYGHTGYTGTSLWVDPTRSLLIALLTNRVHKSRDPEPIRRLRASVCDAVVDDLFGDDRHR